MKSSSNLGKLALATLALGITSSAFAGAMITSGSIALGVNDEGHLNFGSGITQGAGGALGIAIKTAAGGWADATSPGCLCEGWGVSASGVSGFANVSTDGGANNLSVDSFSSTATTATSIVHLTGTPSLVVKQEYFPAPEAPGSLFQNKVTITNTGLTDMTNLRYVRVMDWDVPTTEFNEFVTIKGTGTTSFLELSHDDGFESANPLDGISDEILAGTTNVDFTDSGPTDHGAFFRFNFGTLKAGESRTFSVYYGATYSETSMLAALGSVGIELYSLGESNTTGGPTVGTPYTFAFGFKGVGGVDIIGGVPEPTTYGMIGAAALAGLVILRRRMGKA